MWVRGDMDCAGLGMGLWIIMGVGRMGVNCGGVVKDCVCGLCWCEVTGDMDCAGVGMGVCGFVWVWGEWVLIVWVW